MSKFTTKLTTCAMAVALATVLSMLKLYHFPFGGSVTCFSMLVICLPGYWFGLGAGLLTGVAYGLLQLLIDPYILFPLQLVVDYLLAFGALGLSGIFSPRTKDTNAIPVSDGRGIGDKRYLCLFLGYLTAIFGRYLFTVLSGWLFFAEYAWEGWNPLAYSLVYNGAYIFTEGLLTTCLLALPPAKKAILSMHK